MKRNKTILIAGVAGFIGSHLGERFLQEGWKVIGVDNLLTGQEENVKLLSEYPSFKFIRNPVEELEISDLKDLSPAIIAHLASPASPVDFSKIPEAIISANTQGTHHLLEVARQFGSRFLFASTSEIYGDPLVHPQPETYWGNVNPQGSRSVYDESKRLGETYVALYHRKYELDTRIVRIFNTYGPRMRLNDGRVVTNFIKAIIEDKPLPIYGDGSQTRSFCYVDDLVNGLSKMLLVEDLNGETVNLGNDEEITINKLADIFEEIVGHKLERHFIPLPHNEDPKRRRPLLTKAEKLLNYHPQVSLVDGLRRTLKYFGYSF